MLATLLHMSARISAVEIGLLVGENTRTATGAAQ
jgi:hypothetical protein